MDEIVLGSSKYITSAKAAKLVGYSNDYISRLCRAGKLKGYFAGRVWFVELASLSQTFRDQSRSDPNYYEDAVRRLGDNLAPLHYENDNGPVPHPLAVKGLVTEVAGHQPPVPAESRSST